MKHLKHFVLPAAAVLAALLPGCSENNAVLSPDDDSQLTALATIKGYTSFSDSTPPDIELYKATASAGTPLDIISESTNPKLSFAWLLPEGVNSGMDTAVFAMQELETTWPLRFSADIMELPSDDVLIHGKADTADQEFPLPPNTAFGWAVIMLINDTDNDGVFSSPYDAAYEDSLWSVDFQRAEEYRNTYFFDRSRGTDWLMGTAKQHCLLYIPDEASLQPVAEIMQAEYDTVDGTPQIGYNMVEAVTWTPGGKSNHIRYADFDTEIDIQLIETWKHHTGVDWE